MTTSSASSKARSFLWSLIVPLETSSSLQPVALSLLFHIHNLNLRRIRVARSHQDGAGDVGDVADLGNGGNAGAGIGTEFLKTIQRHGIEGDGVRGGQEDARGGGVTGIEFAAPRKFDNEAIGNMQDGFGFDRIAHDDFPDGGVLIGIRLHQASGVVDAAEGKRGATAVDAEIRIAGHGTQIDQLGRFLRKNLGVEGPVRDFVGGLREVGGGHAVHQRWLELQVPINELAHGGVKVRGGVRIPTEAGDVGPWARLHRTNLHLAGFFSEGVSGEDHVLFLFVPEGDLVRLQTGGDEAGGDGIGERPAGAGSAIAPSVDFDGDNVIGTDPQGFPGIGGGGFSGEGGEEGGEGVFDGLRIGIVVVEERGIFEVGNAGFGG